MNKLLQTLFLAAALVLTASAYAQDQNFYIFLCFGQSNMEGFPGIPDADKASVDERFQVLAAVDFPALHREKDHWYAALPPLCRPNSGLSPADYFGRTLVARLPANIKVGVVNVAVGGCKIELFDKANYAAYTSTAPSWMKPMIAAYDGNPYQRLVDLGRIAQKAGVIKGILLHQGESNPNDLAWPTKVKAVYENLLKDLDLRAENVPLLAGETVGADQQGKCAAMNQIIAELPKVIPTAHIVSSAGCTSQPDYLHFTPEGYRELGRRYAETILPLLAPTSTAAGPARISFDVGNVVAHIDPRIYGVFMEPIGFNRPEMKFNTLYGPLYDPGSPLADANGWRKDMLDAARELQLTNMRWPGGNFLGSYDWRDGIGPKDQRPKRLELAWGVVESNQVGTDEWIQLNQLIGSENIVCINMGTGTIDDARYWVEYCNAPAGTYWADQRAKNGHPEPYGIKHWCLGNEVDGEGWIIGYKNAEDYVKFARVVSRAMERSSPGTKLEFTANGSSNYKDTLAWIDWNWTVIKGLSGIARYLSLHRYWDDSKDYYTFVGERAVDLQEKIDITAGQIKAVSTTEKKAPMYISFDEWAPPFRGGHLSTLALAQFFSTFIRNADTVKMANYTLLTSLLGRDPQTGATYKSPLFHAFKLFSTRCRGDALRTTVVCDTFRVDDYYTAIPYLDVSTVYDAKARQVIINVVNRHKDEAIATDITSVAGVFQGRATVTQILSDDITNQPYTYEARDTYAPKVSEMAAAGATLHTSFPAHSFTQIVVGLDRK